MNTVLYILMRTDLPSMNAGKAMAQASHASNAMVAESNKTGLFKDGVTLWQNETKQGFGTCLVLGVTGPQLGKAIEQCKHFGFLADIVIDPTYPYRVNGEVASLLEPENIFEGNKEYTLFRSEVTCGYVFGEKDEIELRGYLKDFKLHP